jgi:hypothetical protein
MLPYDFCQKQGLTPEVGIYEVFKKRTKDFTIGLQSMRVMSEAVIPYFEIEDGKLKTLEFMPVELGYGEPDSNITHFSIEVETVVADPEDEDGGTMNIGTIYSRDLWIDGEYGSVEDTEPTIFIYNKDYELLEDGTLKVRCELLKDYNKNDRVKLCFAEEDSCSLTYKIISKVIYEDGDYYHLDFIG